jgi:hypothetical protein
VVKAALVPFNNKYGANFNYMTANNSVTEEYNALYNTAVCGLMTPLMKTLTTCIPSSCNETTWSYCNNQTFDGQIAGYGSQLTKYAVLLSSALKVLCYGPSLDPATNLAQCKQIFPPGDFGKYTAPVTPPTGAPTKNGTGASSTVEIAVLAAASLVATTMLSF